MKGNQKRNWFAAGIFLAGAVVLGLILLGPCPLSSAQSVQAPPQDAARAAGMPAPVADRMVDVGGRKLHCRVYGSGAPTVALISGFETTQDNWDPLIPALAARATVVTYDRAGVGKSELGSLPADGGQSARDLHRLLEKLAVPKPYILVGHSYGGGVARLFASMFPDAMAGLVLEEVQHEDNLSEMGRILKGKDLETFERVLLPAFAAPDNPRTEGDYRELTRTQLQRSGPLPQMPLVVLACRGRAKTMADMFSAGAIEDLDRTDVALMARLAASVAGGRLVMVDGTGHYVHADKPEIVIAPVAEMIRAARGE
jgi:pimeloyl-ACP methyl ester carboxylesterase